MGTHMWGGPAGEGHARSLGPWRAHRPARTPRRNAKPADVDILKFLWCNFWLGARYQPLYNRPRHTSTKT
jgi:hypothetical protein